MEIMTDVFDGKNLILADNRKILLANVKRASLTLVPYLLFPVWREIGAEKRVKTDMKIIYPHSAANAEEKEQMLHGGERPTRIMHILPLDSDEIIRKPDFKQGHSVELAAYHSLTIQMKNRSEITVDFEGNCHYKLKDAKTLDSVGEHVPLVEFYDRPAHFANVIKKHRIEVYSR